MGLRFAQQGARIIKKNYLVIPHIFISQPAEASSNFDQALSGMWHQTAQRDALCAIFIVALSTIPKAAPVV